MDAVSYANSAKQAQRIKKFIQNPDSTSGIVTVPKVIASGETITIPAGRVAILPNVQIDGVLNVEGEVFIPSGATLGDLDAQLALKATLSSPAFTGTPTAPTQTAQDNSTKLATTAYVDGKMVLGTAVNTTSGTSIDFTSIPYWVKKISVIFKGVSTSGTSNIQVQIGAGTITTSGYSSYSSYITVSTVASTSATSGFHINLPNASSAKNGEVKILNINNNDYVSNYLMGDSGGVSSLIGGGAISLSGKLDRIRITTVNGTDTFDAGQINIMYEG